MRKIISLAPVMFVLVVMVVFMAPASAQINVAVLDISLASQNPYPAEPGSNVNVEIEVSNTGNVQSNNVVVEILVKSPFGLLQGQDAKQTINNIGPQSSIKKTYDLFVGTDAISSTYDLEFRIYSASDPNTYSTKTVSLSVQGTPKMVVDSVETSPKDIEPGGSVALNFKIRNIGSGTARQMQASLNSTSSYLVPILSGGLVYVGDLKPGETKDALMQLSIDSLAEYKTYMATLTLEYKDESNAVASDTFSIGIPVTGSIILDIISIEPNYNRGELDIEVANKGTTDAKSLETTLKIGNQTVGIDYLSQLKSTKKTTFSFPLVLEGNAELMINYVGPGLQQNQITKQITLDYERQSTNGTTTYIIGFVILIIILYFVWRKFFRKKHHHTHHTHHTHKIQSTSHK
jgi:hypothetical protein